MSDTSQGPGWWLASDGKWYPPELWTGPPAGAASAASGVPVSAPGQVPTYPSQAPQYPSQPSEATPYPTGMYPPQGYGQAPARYGGYPSSVTTLTRKTNGLAIASLVCSLAGLLLLPLVLGIVFGFIARSQIKHSHGAQGGGGLALAGIIISFGWAALLIFSAIVDATTHTNTGAVGILGVLG
jgi:hypothetical protein